ncbi:inositol-tetrakisphosphate 1-kinase [Phlyctochytrium arcticum]|nr:inositol-tetrakisphosphate 1-kinase [Phlyctochytrium arcticum]
MSPAKSFALAFTDGKHDKSGWAGFTDYARSKGYNVDILDVKQPSTLEGKADVVIHKLTSVIDKANEGYGTAKTQLANFQRYVADRNAVLIDGVESVSKLLKREDTMDLLQSRSSTSTNEEPLFHVAKYAIVSRESLMDGTTGGVTFPMVLKHLTAASSHDAHQMVIIPSAQQLRSGLEAVAGAPSEEKPGADKWFLQQWINHDGLIFKVFVVGDHVHSVLRPSLKNIVDGDANYKFDSQTIPKAFASSSMGDETAQMFAVNASEADRQSKEKELTQDAPAKIAAFLRKELGLTFFGFDLIVETGSGRHYIIDINYCPGYQGVPHFFEKVLEVVNKASKSA